MAPSYGTARILDPAASDQSRTSAPPCDFKPTVKATGSRAPTRRPSIWRTFHTYLWPKFRGDSGILCRGEPTGIAENMSEMLTQSVSRGGAYFREMQVPAPKTSRELFRLFCFIIKRPVCRVWPSELISRMSKPPKCTSVYCNGRPKVGT